MINVKFLRRIRNQKQLKFLRCLGLENLTPTGIRNISSEFEKFEEMDDGSNATETKKKLKGASIVMSYKTKEVVVDHNCAQSEGIWQRYVCIILLNLLFVFEK